MIVHGFSMVRSHKPTWFVFHYRGQVDENFINFFFIISFKIFVQSLIQIGWRKNAKDYEALPIIMYFFLLTDANISKQSVGGLINTSYMKWNFKKLCVWARWICLGQRNSTNQNTSFSKFSTLVRYLADHRQKVFGLQCIA